MVNDREPDSGSDPLTRLIKLLQEYGEAKFGNEWWPSNADPWLGPDKGQELAELLEAW